MDANDVIDSYVHDVARRLPPRHRDDVAFELRVLLGEDLRTRASAEGREPDADLALRLVRSLGRPSETAARYYPPFTLVHPTDTWSFVAGAVGGAAALSILAAPRQGESFAAAAQRTNVAVLAWLGLLVLLFAGKSLILSRRPQAFAWPPRQGRRVPGKDLPAHVGRHPARLARPLRNHLPAPAHRSRPHPRGRSPGRHPHGHGLD